MREPEAVERLISLSFLSQGLLVPLGIDAEFSWFLLRVRTDRLVKALQGDVDILADQLNWSRPGEFVSLLAEEVKREPEAHPDWHQRIAAVRLAQSGGIRWPPSTEHLVGIEAKLGYLDRLTGRLKSTKSSRQKRGRIHLEVDKLVGMGLDHVALLDIIANPPAGGNGQDGQAWLEALRIAECSQENLEVVLADRLPPDSVAGHWVWSAGAVMGGNELQRGAGAPVQLRPPKVNSMLRDRIVQGNRNEVERNLRDLLARMPAPTSFPVILVDCRSCGTIHDVESCGTGA